MITSFEEYTDILDNCEASAWQRAITEAVSEDVLLRTIQERPDLKTEVIRNKLVPEQVLVALVDDPDPMVRYWVAKKRKLPMLYLEMLANDPDDGVRREVVHHAKITKLILEVLAEDRSLDIAKRAVRRLEARDYRD